MKIGYFYRLVLDSKPARILSTVLLFVFALLILAPELIALFEVEELEERLENKWTASVSTTTNQTTGTSVTASASVQFE